MNAGELEVVAAGVVRPAAARGSCCWRDRDLASPRNRGVGLRRCRWREWQQRRRRAEAQWPKRDKRPTVDEGESSMGPSLEQTPHLFEKREHAWELPPYVVS